MATEGQKEAVKTYIEQTKLLVTLASTFLFAPAGLVTILKDRTSTRLDGSQLFWFVAVEIVFILSVLAGYVVLASLSGSQATNEFNVYRPATRISSLIQFGTYVLGLIMFMKLAIEIVS